MDFQKKLQQKFTKLMEGKKFFLAALVGILLLIILGFGWLFRSIKIGKVSNGFLRHKKNVIIGGLVVIVIAVAGGFWFSHIQNEKKLEREAVLKKQKAEEIMVDKKKNATWSRPSFFLSAPTGGRGALNVPSYIEGGYRMSDTYNKDRKMTVSYVKNSNYETPMFYIRFDDNKSFKLGANEELLKTSSANYTYAYYFYPVSSYTGPEKDDFSLTQEVFKESLKSFATF